MSFEIQKGLPVPTTRKTGRSYPFAQMAVGDSFLVPDAKRSCPIGTNAINFTKKHQPTWKFTTRKLPEGVRVWRIQ
jgi:hypothetical protein